MSVTRTAADLSANSQAELRADAEPRAGGRASASRPYWARVAVLSGVFSAALPAPQAMLGASAGMGFRKFYGELRFMHAFERDDALPYQGRVSFYSDQAGALGCGLFEFVRARLHVSPCLHVFAVRTSGAAADTTDPESRVYYWALGGASGRIALLLYGPFELGLEGGASLPLSRAPRFVVSPYGDVARTAAVAVHGALSLGARW